MPIEGRRTAPTLSASALYDRIRSLRAERDAAHSIQRWVELTHEIDEVTGRIAKLRWEESRTSSEEAEGAP